MSKPESRDIVSSKPESDSTVPKHVSIGAIKAVLGTIPLVGSALNEILFDVRSRIQQDRVNSLVQRLSIGVETLGENKIDWEYLASEEFSDVLADILLRTARTRSDAKRERFARIIVGALGGQKEGAFDHMYRQFVEELSDDDVDVLCRFAPVYTLSRDADKADDWKMPLTSVLNYQEEKVFDRSPIVAKKIIQNLIRMGLLFDDSHGRLSTAPYTVIMPTDLGAAFHEWLQALPTIPL